MRKKSGFTIVEQAIILVFAFEDVVRKMEQQGVTSSHSVSRKPGRAFMLTRYFIGTTRKDSRGSGATHLLEQGLNIVTLKELLGHASITSTMIYLHVAQCPLIKAHSPLDRLYTFRKDENKV